MLVDHPWNAHVLSARERLAIFEKLSMLVHVRTENGFPLALGHRIVWKQHALRQTKYCKEQTCSHSHLVQDRLHQNPISKQKAAMEWCVAVRFLCRAVIVSVVISASCTWCFRRETVEFIVDSKESIFLLCLRYRPRVKPDPTRTHCTSGHGSVCYRLCGMWFELNGGISSCITRFG